MTQYEYKIVPAPAKGLKGQGIKSPEARYANALETLMNQLAGDGWEYQRADTLPSTERAGLTGSITEWRHLLVFRRALPEARTEKVAVPDPPEILLPPVKQVVEDTPEQDVTKDTPDGDDDAKVDKDEQKTPRQGATQMLSDNGVEDTSEVSGMTNSLQNLASNRNRLKGVTRGDN
ncbi:MULTISPECIES: DUF4177 domain-containing protein [Roseobacteraceae]|uniref:DUF4177 domain-containing protein n=1 Tax=Pseudosulfitobacter pseudonitzschiae TaxID=1402135 RepID=A0A221K155_9RHOB|nr:MULTISPECIES: DUF4177 domain-containing protein [Roseobacteraceae]ASM72728.1 hypothetical protein SULPSESMR1_01920 [Pseudosulfitobacter pseudonitzschiae]